MNISIFASIWCQNLWDELILKNEIDLLKSEFQSTRPVSRDQSQELYFKVASYEAHNPLFHIQNTSYFEYFPLWIKQLKNIFRNIRDFFKFLSVIIWSDRVVIGWGWIIYDSELQSVWNPLNQWLFRARVARFFRKKIYFYAVWVDIKNADNNQILEKIFKKAWKITVRDEKSQQQLIELWIQSEIVDDPVMSENFQPHHSSHERIERGVTWNILWTHNSKNFKLKDFDTYNFQWKKVWLALRSWYIWTSWDARVEKLLIEELCSYIEKKWGKITFIPHSLHPSDKQANDYEFMKQFLNYEREIYVNLTEVYTAYNHQMIDIVISMRLHSIILSHVYGIDQIVLSYSQKTDEVIKKLSQ
jgi:polysaccharide pyruvyl transferase WcaK-like protein